MKFQHFASRNASLEYDKNAQTIYIAYQGQVRASDVLRVHEWMHEIVNQFGIKNIQGTVLDLRSVDKFPANALTALQVSGMDGRYQYDFCELPAAMIVRNAYQGKMMTMVSNDMHTVEHFQTVYDMNSAKMFIEDRFEQNKPSGAFGLSALFGQGLSAARA